jgi:hypothetical protein
VVIIYIAYWLLLVVVVYSLNTMLRQQLDRPSAITKAIPAAIVVIMGVLSGALAGIRGYIYSEQPRTLFRSLYDLLEAQQKLTAAYYSLYLVSLLASGGLALNSIMTLRRTSKPTGVSRIINLQLRYNSNTIKGLDWLGHRAFHRHDILGHYSDRHRCVVSPRRRLHIRDLHHLELPHKLWPSSQLHLYPLHCKARIMA